MLVGHLAAGFVGKRLEPKVSLGVLVIAALFADFIFFPLLLAGIENVAPSPQRRFEPSRRTRYWL